MAEEEEGDQTAMERNLERAGTNGQEWATIAEDRGRWKELTTKVEEATM